MASSGGGGGGNPMALMGQNTPMPGLPIAGKDSSIGDPYEYGKFQNFLPDIKAEGMNDMATGLRPDMFNYNKPGANGGTGADAGGGAGDQLRDALAAVVAGGGGGGGFSGGAGMFGNAANGLKPPEGAQQLPEPPGGWASGNVPGWPIPPRRPDAPGFATDWRAKDAAEAAAAAAAAKPPGT
jgi:hypothetical protein